MRKPSHKHWYYGIVLAVVLLVAIISIWAMSKWLDRSRGNEPIQFYGRIVDEQLQPLPDVEVTINVLYATRNVPAASGRDENTRKLTMQTDQNGDFRLTDTSGYAFHIASIKLNKQELSFFGIPPRCNFQRDTIPSQLTVADQPAKRLVYSMIRPK